MLIEYYVEKNYGQEMKYAVTPEAKRCLNLLDFRIITPCVKLALESVGCTFIEVLKPKE
jgi:hypothetical protein